MPSNAIDMTFIASHSNMTTVIGTQPEKLLRLQFLEAIVRLAKEKYKDLATYSESLEQLIENDIIPNCEFIWNEWHGFR